MKRWGPNKNSFRIYSTLKWTFIESLVKFLYPPRRKICIGVIIVSILLIYTIMVFIVVRLEVLTFDSVKISSFRNRDFKMEDSH